MLPQRANIFRCSIVRQVKLAVQNDFYKLTTPPRKPLAYPNQTTNLLQAVPFPLLNQPSVNVLLRSALVPELAELEWLIRYVGMAQRNKVLVKKTIEFGNRKPFTTYLDYAQLLKNIRKKQPKGIVSITIPGTVRNFTIILGAYGCIPVLASKPVQFTQPEGNPQITVSYFKIALCNRNIETVIHGSRVDALSYRRMCLSL